MRERRWLYECAAVAQQLHRCNLAQQLHRCNLVQQLHKWSHFLTHSLWVYVVLQVFGSIFHLNSSWKHFSKVNTWMCAHQWKWRISRTLRRRWSRGNESASSHPPTCSCSAQYIYRESQFPQSGCPRTKTTAWNKYKYSELPLLLEAQRKRNPQGQKKGYQNRKETNG